MFIDFKVEEPFKCVPFGGSGTLLLVCLVFPFFFFFILAVDGHKNGSGERCSGKFVEEGSTKASHRCLSLFSTVKEIVQASLGHDKQHLQQRFELETYTLGLPLICFRDYGYGNST